MGVDRVYADSYDLAGQVAVLTEGDLVGYEAGILRKWADQTFGTDPLIDVRPCGTSSALVGFSDAVGRSRPLLVIEDLDFRRDDQAQKDCQKQEKNRKQRGILLLAWRTWRRNEIENYLVEPAVLLPVMSQAFACPLSDVQAAVSEILSVLTVFQAAQYALYQARRSWSGSDPTPIVSNNLPSRPSWDRTSGMLDPPDRDAVRERLKQNIDVWRQKLVHDSEFKEPFKGDEVLANFDAKCEEWQNIGWEDSRWRVEWAGKEMLQWLRRLLSSRYGWYDRISGERADPHWVALNRSQRDALDRKIERTLSKDLEDSFLRHLASPEAGDLRGEWADIEVTVRGWRSVLNHSDEQD